MQDRFRLRFQNGEREGESVPITSPRFTLGRKPGNTLQIQDASVSGQHAEILVDASGVLLRDLGSTNGTRIAGEKIDEGRPAHGDQISFGSIHAILEDSQLLDEPVKSSSAVASSSAGAGLTVDVVTAEMVAKSRKGSKFALLGVLVLLLAGGAAAFYFMTGSGGESGGKVAAVVPVPGNKIGGYSFEGDAAPANWSSEQSAPAYFSQWAEARATGKSGMRAGLSTSEWALLSSDAVGVSVGRTVELSAKLRARSGAAGRIGVEFLPPAVGEATPAPPLNVAWGPWLRDVAQHQEIQVSAGVPPGASQARILVEARADNTSDENDEGGGSVDVDDVSLIDGSGAAAPFAKVGEYAFWLHGNPTGVAQVTKVSRWLLSDVHATMEGASRDLPLACEGTASGFSIQIGSARTLSLRAEAAAWSEGIASIGPAGLLDHAAEFEAQEVTSLLLGTGHDLIALKFDRPTAVSGRREGDGVRLKAELTSGGFTLQVDFRDERARAGDLAFAARNAEQAKQLGECLARWSELLDTVPYEAKLVQEARATRSRLEQAGLVELAEVKAEFERARFFRLVDLFRQSHARALSVGQKYAGSAVQVQAQELVADVDVALGELEVDLFKDEVTRLKSILSVLEQTESPRLAEEIRGYLKREFGVEN